VAIRYTTDLWRDGGGGDVLRVALAFGTGIVGVSFAAIFVRLALPAPPVVTGFYRMLFASGLLLPAALWLAVRGGDEDEAPRRGIPPRAAAWALAAGALFGSDLALWNTSLVETSVSNATLLVNTTPIHVGLFSRFVLGQRLSTGFVWGACVAIGGCALLLGAEPDLAGSSRGDLLALGAAVFLSGYLLMMKRAREELAARHAVWLACLSASAVLGLSALALGDPLRGFPAHSWAAMAGAAAVSQVGGVLLIAWSLRYLPATFASLALLGQPIGTTLLGWLLLSESLSATQLAGGLTILLGILLASRTARYG
jgi:drug/metabolite transporter (DMT)-like permease